MVIPVHFTGSGATSENVSAIVNRDNQLDTGDSHVKIEVVPTDKPINGVLNTMDLSSGYDFKNYPKAGEGVNKLGGNEGHINTDAGQPNANNGAAHDNLHFAGVRDQYDEGKKDKDGHRTSTPKPGYDSTNIVRERN